MAAKIIHFNKQYEVPADELFLLCGTAIENLKKGRVLSTDPVMGRLEAQFGGTNNLLAVNAGGHGINIEVIPDSSEASTLTVESYALNGYGRKIPFGGQKVAQLGLDLFIKEVETRIQRTKIKYG